MPRLNVETSEDLKNRLEQFADDKEITQSGAVRLALDEYLPQGDSRE